MREKICYVNIFSADYSCTAYTLPLCTEQRHPPYGLAAMQPIPTRARKVRERRALTGISEILVMGSIFSTQPMLTSGTQSAQLTWAHLLPLRVLFMAPPRAGQRTQGGRMPRAQGRHTQDPSGMRVMP